MSSPLTWRWWCNQCGQTNRRDFDTKCDDCIRRNETSAAEATDGPAEAHP